IFFDQELEGSVDEPTESESTYTLWDYSPASVPAKRRSPWLIGGALVLLSLTIIIVVAVTNQKRHPQPEPKPNIPDAPPGMVCIAGGDFMMGSNNGDEYERP